MENIQEEEMWKDMEGYEDLYQVSNLGRIKSLKNKNGINRELILKNLKSNKGYTVIGLYYNSVRKGLRIHRIVALHFLDNPENKSQVNHKDGDKSNNCVDNLEWCSPSENIIHAYTTGLNKGCKGIKRKGKSSLLGKLHSEESKRNMRLGQKGKKFSEKTKLLWSKQRKGKFNVKARAVEAYNPITNQAIEGMKFDTVTDAKKFINKKSTGGINTSLKNKNRTSGGYHWRYLLLK